MALTTSSQSQVGVSASNSNNPPSNLAEYVIRSRIVPFFWMPGCPRSPSGFFYLLPITSAIPGVTRTGDVPEKEVPWNTNEQTPSQKQKLRVGHTEGIASWVIQTYIGTMPTGRAGARMGYFALPCLELSLGGGGVEHGMLGVDG